MRLAAAETEPSAGERHIPRTRVLPPDARHLRHRQLEAPTDAVVGDEPFFSVEISCDADMSLLRVRGELDLATARIMNHALDDVLARGAPRVVLDAARLQFLDAAGAGSFCVAAETLSARGGTFVVRNAAPFVRTVLAFVDTAGAVVIEPEPDPDPDDGPPAA